MVAQSRLNVIEDARQHEIHRFDHLLRMFGERVGRGSGVFARAADLQPVVEPCDADEQQQGRQRGHQQRRAQPAMLQRPLRRRDRL